LSPAEKIERQLGMSLDRAAEILCWPLADLDPRLALFYRRTDHPDKLRRRPWHTSVLGRSACVPGYFTKIEVADPHLFTQTIWESIPPGQKVLLAEHEFSSQEWAPFDQRRFRIEPENYRTAASVANVGALRASRITGNGATETTLRSPGSDGFGLSIIERGANRLVLPGTDEPLTRQCHDRIYL